MLLLLLQLQLLLLCCIVRLGSVDTSRAVALGRCLLHVAPVRCSVGSLGWSEALRDDSRDITLEKD